MITAVLQHISNYFSRPTSTLYIRFAHIRLNGHDLAHPFEWIIAIISFILFAVFSPTRKRPKLLNSLRQIARHRYCAPLLVFLLSIGGRLALLTIEPFPAPSVHDEFSYLLAADTFAHGKIASPTPLDFMYFEGFHILLTPTYASMYPPGSALFYGVGQLLFHTPRAGLLLLMGISCASLCWMLQMFVPPGWALLGGIIAVVHISWFSYFGNTYWGGASAMLGGCILAGAFRKIIVEKGDRSSSWILFSLAFLLLINTRPFEGTLVAIPALLRLVRTFFLQSKSRKLPRLSALLVLCIGLMATAGYAVCVTHSFQLPWSLQRKQWAIVPPFIFQSADYRHTYEFKDQKDLYLDYEVHDYKAQHHLRGFLEVLFDKGFREWLFFISPALTLCFLLGLGPTIRSAKNREAIIGLMLLCCASSVETWVQPQYVAVATGTIYVIFMNGLRRSVTLTGRKRLGAAVFPATAWGLGVLVCLRLFIVPIVSWPPSWDVRSYEMLTYDKLCNLLRQMPGKQLVLVHYDSNHQWMDSWINNGADIASQKVIWAREPKLPGDKRRLLCDYPNRTPWLITAPNSTGLEADPDRTDSARNSDVSHLLIRIRVHSNNCSNY